MSIFTSRWRIEPRECCTVGPGLHGVSVLCCPAVANATSSTKAISNRISSRFVTRVRGVQLPATPGPAVIGSGSVLRRHEPGGERQLMLSGRCEMLGP